MFFIHLIHCQGFRKESTFFSTLFPFTFPFTVCFQPNSTCKTSLIMTIYLQNSINHIEFLSSLKCLELIFLDTLHSFDLEVPTLWQALSTFYFFLFTFVDPCITQYQTLMSPKIPSLILQFSFYKPTLMHKICFTIWSTNISLVFFPSPLYHISCVLISTTFIFICRPILLTVVFLFQEGFSAICLP